MPDERRHDEPAAPAIVDRGTLLRDAIEQEYAALRRGVEALVWRFNLTRDRNVVRGLAEEVLHEAVARAFRRAEAFEPTRSAHAWLLGFAVNVIRERGDRARREQQHVVSIDAPARVVESGDSTATLAERIFDPSALREARVTELLDLVGPQDRMVLQLAFVEGMSGRALADALGVREGAARVRLSRALRRLTDAYHRAERM